MTETERAYLAGILDGEGCISASKPPIHISVQVSNTDLPLLEWLAENFGGSITLKKQPGKTAYVWQRKARSTKPLLEAALPYLRVKRKQAVLALNFVATYNGSPVMAEREQIADELRELNHA